MTEISQQQPVPKPPPQMNPIQEQLNRIKSEPLLAPSHTVYCQNLNERIKLVDLKNSLFQLFSTYGEVHEVHAKSNVRQRGQAYVVMQSEKCAEQAIRTLRGYPFFGKPLRLNFSKKESDLISKIQGTFDEQILKVRAQRHMRDEKQRELKMQRKMINSFIKLRKQTAQMMNQELDPRFGGRPTQSGIHKILFIERLPRSVKPELLEDIFKVCHGFVEVRPIPEKEVAFVEFVADDFASQALTYVTENQLLVFQDGAEMVQARITYGKK